MKKCVHYLSAALCTLFLLFFPFQAHAAPTVGRTGKIALDIPISKDIIGRALKNNLRPHKNEYWCIPSREDAEFIACMEDVLDVYEIPYNSKRSAVCMNEKPYQLLGEVRSLPAHAPWQ